MKENTTTMKMIEEMQKIFARNGLPYTIVANNGPQYASHEFQIFVGLIIFKSVILQSINLHPMIKEKTLLKQSSML